MKVFRQIVNRNESAISSEVVKVNNPFVRLRNRFSGPKRNLTEFEKFELMHKQKPSLLKRFLPKPKNDFELRRFHPHMLRPYTNDNFSMRIFTHQTLSIFLLTIALLTGYCYARLTRDEYCRRAMYGRQANFMLLVDQFALWYDTRYDRIKKRIVEFDSSFLSWQARQIKIEEWKETRSRRKEIYDK